MKYINLYETQADFLAAKDSLDTPQVALIVNDGIGEGKEALATKSDSDKDFEVRRTGTNSPVEFLPYLIATYNITDISATTNILSTVSGKVYDLTEIDYMLIDDSDEQIEPTANYQFSTTGEHKVTYVFKKQSPSLKYMWVNNPNLISIDLHLSSVSNLERAFQTVSTTNANKLNYIKGLENILDTSKCTSLMTTFQYLGSNTDTSVIDKINISSWDVSNVKSLLGLLNKAYNIKYIGKLDNWNVSNCNNAQQAFCQCHNLETIGDISNWDVSNITTFYATFDNNYKINTYGDLSNWNVSNVTDMQYMFNENILLESVGDLSKWNTTKVKTMEHMFCACHNLNSIGDISNWDVSSCTSFYSTFHARKLKNLGDLSNWDVSNVTNMRLMFARSESSIDSILSCEKMGSIGDISNWDVSKVSNMNAIFQENTECVNGVDFSKWDTSKCTSMNNMFCNPTNRDELSDLSIDDLKEHLGYLYSVGVPSIKKGCNTTNMFSGQIFLTDIINAGKISASVSFSDSPLTRESAIKLFNALDSENVGTLTLSTTTKDYLSQDDIKIATDKGWTVA